MNIRCDPIEVSTYSDKARFTIPRGLRTQLGLPKDGDVWIHLIIEDLATPAVIFDDDWQLKSGSEVYGEEIRRAGVKAGGQRLRITVALPIFRTIVTKLNSLSHTHPVGAIQEVRAALKGSSRRLGPDIFSSQTTKDRYAFHFGGRSELQFNIALERTSGSPELRYGVAFSFQPNRSLPRPVDVLAPKVRLFNDFMELNAESFRDLRMWHDEDDLRSADYMPAPIPWERVKNGVFVFLGKRQAVGSVDYEDILSELDRLLPLYKYVESGGAAQPVSMPSQAPFEFRPRDWSDKLTSTVATQVQRQLDIALRHNEMQKALYRQLVSKYGKANVTYENPSGVGTRVDVVVQQGKDYWFYEIKTASSPRACLREAIGQLLEYAFWPGAQIAARLVVVGETAIDKDGSEYLRRLNRNFPLPIAYEQVVENQQ